MKNLSWLTKLALAASMLVAVAAPASATAVRTAVGTGNFTFAGAAQIPIPAMTTTGFANNANQRFLVTFSSECSVSAPAGSNSAWTDVDIVVLNAAGAVVATLQPTVGSADGFCGSNGTAGFDGWEMNSITAVSPAVLAAGNYRVEVRARLNGGATGGWFGERSLVVWR